MREATTYEDWRRRPVTDFIHLVSISLNFEVLVCTPSRDLFLKLVRLDTVLIWGYAS
jgi:hypothetical protein